jgi:2-oxoisovalerate dehydrogenase E2 component (dihydrolipoyl transacylase)
MGSSASLRMLRSVLRGHSSNSCGIFNRPVAYVPRNFCTSPLRFGLISQKLYDVGEGTKEAEIIQWYVEEGARVEEWGKLCEVMTDKSSVDITSKHAGVIKKLHAEKDKIVQVGEPLVDIEVEGLEDGQTGDVENEVGELDKGDGAESAEAPQESKNALESTESSGEKESAKTEGKYAALATPAVRGLLKEHGIATEDIQGSGKDGRVMKEDVLNHISTRESGTPGKPVLHRPLSLDTKQTETPQRLTPVQNQMFKTMTTSLTIPHFLYSDTINVTRLSALRARLNASRDANTTPKLSYMPFVVKAVSVALNQYPLLNSRVDVFTDSAKPKLLMRSNHNIGVAMDTPAGLLVPVIKSVNARSIVSIANEMMRLSELGQSGKLGTSDLSGGTITVSNVGSIGGDVVAPIIVEGQVAIMGMGKVKAMPIFSDDGVTVQRAEMMGMSWSADHRVVDGATMARAARVVQELLEDPSKMLLELT